MSKQKRYLPTRKVCERYHRDPRTIARWIKNPPPGFPAPIMINGRWFFDEGELEGYEQMLASSAKAA